MLHVKIDIVPFGVEAQRRTLATVKIANISGQYDDPWYVSDYAVIYERDGCEVWAYVNRFHRREGAASLVKEALIAVGQ